MSPNNKDVERGILFTQLLHNLGVRENENIIRLLRTGAHPRTQGDPEATALFQGMINETLSARQVEVARQQTEKEAEEAIEEAEDAKRKARNKKKAAKKKDPKKAKENEADGAVRQAARGIFAVLTEPNSKAQGLGGTQDLAMRQALLMDPGKIREKAVYNKLVIGHPPRWVGPDPEKPGKKKKDDLHSGWAPKSIYDRPVSEWVSFAEAQTARLIASGSDKKAVSKARAAEKHAKESVQLFMGALNRAYPETEDEWTTPKKILELPRDLPYVGKGSVPLVPKISRLFGFDASNNNSIEFAYGTWVVAASKTAALQTQIQKQRAKNVVRGGDAKKLRDEIPEHVRQTLLRIEAEVGKVYEQRSGNASLSGYTITGRALKGFDKILKAWRKAKDKSPSNLMALASEVVSKLTSDSGDLVLVERLAQTDAHCVWDAAEAPKETAEDALDPWTYIFKWKNANRLAVEHSIPKFTPADPLYHPAHPELFTGEGCNGLQYQDLIPEGISLVSPDDLESVSSVPELEPVGDKYGSVTVRLVMLKEKSLEYKPTSLEIMGKGQIVSRQDPAGNRQFFLKIPLLKKKPRAKKQYELRPIVAGGSKLKISRSWIEHFDATADEESAAKIAEARRIFESLQFKIPDRADYGTNEALVRGLRRVTNLLLDAWGGLPPIYLDITIEVDALEQDALSRFFFRSSAVNHDALLGRQFVAHDVAIANGGGIAVFQFERNNGKGIYLTKDLQLKVVHSEVLYLPGDREVSERLNDLRSLIDFSKLILQYQQGLTSEACEKAREPLRETILEDREDFAKDVEQAVSRLLDENESFSDLKVQFTEALRAVQALVVGTSWQTALKAVENLTRILNKLTRLRYTYQPLQYEPTQIECFEGRRRCSHKRNGKRVPMGGVSSYKLDVLGKFIKYEKSFAKRRFLDHKNGLTPSPKRVDHLRPIRRLRDTLTLLIKERARVSASYVDQVAREYQALAVVIERLDEFKMDENRDKRVNRTLQKLVHRQIHKNLTNACKSSGIPLVEQNPSWTSSFDYSTGAPGVRVQPLTPKFAKHKKWKKMVKDKPSLANACVGDLIPIKGGPLFVTLKDGKITVEDSEQRAAQNIGIARVRELLEAKDSKTSQYRDDTNDHTVTVALIDGKPDESPLCVVLSPFCWRGLTFAQTEETPDHMRGPVYEIPENKNYSKRVYHRDCSGQFRCVTTWTEPAKFWSIVENTVIRALSRTWTNSTSGVEDFAAELDDSVYREGASFLRDRTGWPPDSFQDSEKTLPITTPLPRPVKFPKAWRAAPI